MVVWMPRLPTIRVIGSQDIFTVRVGVSALIGDAPRPRRSGFAPLGLEVERVAGVLAELADRPAVGGDGLGRELRAGRLVEQRRLHELVREAGHGAADADAADVGAAADAAHP